MVTPVQQSAVNDITHKLRDGGWTDWVTHAEMNDVAGRLRGLSATDADAVVDELARTGQLDRFASESVDGSWFGRGGYSAGERRDLYVDLAGKLDGQSLATLSQALARTDAGGGDGHARVADLAAAVASHAGAGAKVDYIRALAPSVSDARSHSTSSFGSSAIHESDAEASAIGTVLGTLRGSQAQAAFAVLATPGPGGRDALREVLRSGVDATLRTSSMGMSAHATLSWNTGGARGVLDAAASIGDADLKARIFDAGADTMRSVRDSNGVFGGLTVIGKDAALRDVAGGLTRILDSDTTGVMRELTYNRATLDGSDMAAYAKQMLQSGGEVKLGEIMARLQFGNGLNENAVARLDRVTTLTGGQQVRAQAGALGYFVGSTYAATAAISRDVRAQQEMTTAVLKSALTVIDKARVGGPAALAVGTTASVAKEWVQFAVRAAIADPGSSAATQLERAALPIDPATGEIAVGDAITQAIGDTLGRTSRLSNP